MTNNKIATFAPQGKTKGIILLLHGVNLDPERMDELADKFAKNGFQVLRPALSGHNRNSRNRSRITVDIWIDDMRDFSKVAKEAAAQKNLPLFFVGFSLGALVGLSMLQAEQNGETFKKMCLISPALTLPKKGFLINLLRPFKKLYLPVPFSKYYMVKSTIPAIFLTNILKMIKTLNKNRFHGSSLPTLVIMDKQDKAINPQTITTIPDKFKLNDWSFMYLKATNKYHHLITDERALGQKQWKRMINEIVTFFSTKIIDKNIPHER